MARKATYDRDDVLRRARNLFWEKGYRGTSLKDLEAALNLRPGSIYAAFGSKEALFADALTTYAEETGAAVRETLASAGSPLAGLAAHARSFGRLCETDAPSRACMLAKTVLETPDDDPVLRGLAERFMADAERLFEERFSAAKEAGEISENADPRRLARRYQAAIIGLRAYAQRQVDPEAVKELAEDLAQDIEAMATSRAS